MTRLNPRRWWSASLLGLLAVGGDPSPGQATPRAARPAPSTFSDPRLEPIRRASVSWESRQGPERSVVDQVCLVPDLPTFLEAIGSWDRSHFFPVLFDDVESSFRFIKAFRPARIVRMPKSAGPMAADRAWDRAVEAVGASWKSEANPGTLRGDFVPKTLGPTTPGVVLSAPTAPMLAGAVALAAGRFQPLLRLGFAKRFDDELTADEVASFDRVIASKVVERIPNYDRLRDDCDFLTIGGDYPYRYRDSKGELEAVDDRIGRSVGSDQRWAFAGRLLGDASESAYRAMCSLFLQPDSALMFNGYDDGVFPWSLYSMSTASIRLSASVPTSQISGDLLANLEGWHETFDPSNRFGLILINSHGSPIEFHLRGGPAHAPDIPRGVPSAILMIHSYSAANPTDPSTVAGRWLANGAFVFFGSINEPYLDAFRQPGVEAEMIAQQVPLVVAARKMADEARGKPWRLVYLGDPLYRIKSKPERAASIRLDRWEPTSQWPSEAEGPRPSDGDDPGLFLWSLKTALARLQDGGTGQVVAEDLVEALLTIRRPMLPESSRPIYDSLLIEVLLQAKKRTALKARLAAIPDAERSATVKRTLETILTIDFHLALAQKDVSKAQAAWLDLMKTGTTLAFKQQVTTRLGRLAEASSGLDQWNDALRAALRDRPVGPDSEVITAEWKRVDQARRADR